MKVNYVKTIGFRKFKKLFETELYNVTNISGKNRSGKSNILYTIINIVLGTNLSGDEKACLINKNCDASYGELHFTDKLGTNHILVRGKHRYDNSKNFITLDGKPVTQKDLISFYKDKKLFLSILNPLYFLSKKPSEQKELVDKYLSDICPNNLMEIVYNKLSKKEQEILEGIPKNIPTYITELNKDIKKFDNTITALNGKIEYAQNIADQKVPSLKAFERDEELLLARQEFSYLNTNQNIIDKEKQKKLINELEKDILSKETEFNELETSMKIGKKKYLEIKTGISSVCPTCSQHIQDESKKQTITNMYNDLISKYDKRNLLETKVKELKLKLATEKCKYHSLEGNPTIEKSKRITIIEDNIKQLEDEKLEIEKFNSAVTLKENAIKNAKADILNFNKQKQANLKYIDNVNKAKKVAQKLYISYIEEKMKLAKQYLKDVDIKFYSVLKTTGEIKEDFIITYKNIPLSDLSRSETIATALEFANMFNQISRANFPIFIDDYECCTDYNFIKDYARNTQLIISKVEKGNLLKIEDYNNKGNCTIIKPIVTGYRTMCINKNNLAEQKVA